MGGDIRIVATSSSKSHFSFKKCINQQKTTIHYFLFFSFDFLFEEFCSKKVESGSVNGSLQNEKLKRVQSINATLACAACVYGAFLATAVWGHSGLRVSLGICTAYVVKKLKN